MLWRLAPPLLAARRLPPPVLGYLAKGLALLGAGTALAPLVPAARWHALDWETAAGLAWALPDLPSLARPLGAVVGLQQGESLQGRSV